VVDGISPFKLIRELPFGQEVGRSQVGGSARRINATAGAYVDSGQSTTNNIIVGNTLDPERSESVLTERILPAQRGVPAPAYPQVVEEPGREYPVPANRCTLGTHRQPAPG